MPLPSGYTRLQYIKSFGAQYINTGFKPNQDTRVVCKAKMAVGSTTNWLLGSYESGSVRKFYFAASKNGYYLGSYNTQDLAFPASCNTEEIFVLDANKNVFTLTGKGFSETKESTYSNFTTPTALCLFATSANGAVAYGSVSIYSCRIYDNGTIVRNFVPCKNASGVVGMYDTVNGLFYSNMGTGTFSAGAEVKPSYKVVDSNDLDSAIEASADTIRSKSKVADKMNWSMHDGFSSVIAAISGGSSGGGIKIAEGQFIPDCSYGVHYIVDEPITISGLGFKPTRVIVYAIGRREEGSAIVSGTSISSGLLMIDTAGHYLVSKCEEEYDEYEDEYYEYWYFSDPIGSEKPYITLNSGGFTIDSSYYGTYNEIQWLPLAYRYIAFG